MSVTQTRRIQLIAWNVRLKLEKERIYLGTHHGSPIKSTLNGLCDTASERIVSKAKHAGYENIRTVKSLDGSHMFVLWTQANGHKWLIDVTATQFNNRRPKVCMLHVTSTTRLPYYWQLGDGS